MKKEITKCKKKNTLFSILIMYFNQEKFLDIAFEDSIAKSVELIGVEKTENDLKIRKNSKEKERIEYIRLINEFRRNIRLSALATISIVAICLGIAFYFDKVNIFFKVDYSKLLVSVGYIFAVFATMQSIISGPRSFDTNTLPESCYASMKILNYTIALFLGFLGTLLL